MAGNLDFAWDQRLFDRTLVEYMKVSSRTFAEIVNHKAYYVARKALWFTPRTAPGVIETSLGHLVPVTRTVKSVKGGVVSYRKRVKRYELRLAYNEEWTAPLAVLILQKRAVERGGRSPWHGKARLAGAKAMEAAVRNFIVARQRSVAFLKAGWLPAIQALERAARPEGGLPPKDAKSYGRPKGRGEAAREGFRVRALIENFARTQSDPSFEALRKYGAPALQRAFDDEAASMWEYVKRKMEPDARAFNAAQRG